VRHRTEIEGTIGHARRVLWLGQRLRHWATASVQASRPGKELSFRQLETLFGIRQGLTSPGELARKIRVTPAVVTGLIDRLVRQGFVQRDPDPEDRRRLKLALTESGLAVSHDVEKAVIESLAAELATAETAELEGLGRALDILERALLALEARTLKSTDPDEEAWGENREES